MDAAEVRDRFHDWFAGRGWTLTRWGRGFSDEDLEAATALLPLVAVLTKRALRVEAAGESEIVLTQREHLILDRVARGWTASRIANELAISERTVGKHLEHAYRKLGVGDRISAVRLAIELNLIFPSPFWKKPKCCRPALFLNGGSLSAPHLPP